MPDASAHGKPTVRSKQTMTPEPFVTADDIAKHLKITRPQALEMTRKPIIPAHPLGTGEHRRAWRYKISEVDSTMSSSGRRLLCQTSEGIGQHAHPRYNAIRQSP